ncbi:MAG: hypothetical protein U0974_02810 [Gemmatimonadales bacterium]|nr:hypothetical protein [Gemmatimonadales bacterium]MDZ4388644.1 hypothetical protein [Gemmatimonadales bacterium]
MTKARRCIDRELKRARFETIDATSIVSGKDFLAKIWNLMLGCPVGIAIVHEGIPDATLANIYYELGILQAYGRETLVVRVGDPKLPSDTVRTEWIRGGTGLAKAIRGFLDGLDDRGRYYLEMSSLMDRDPLRAVDYLRRAAILSGDDTLLGEARRIWTEAAREERAKTSVEELALSF